MMGNLIWRAAEQTLALAEHTAQSPDQNPVALTFKTKVIFHCILAANYCKTEVRTVANHILTKSPIPPSTQQVFSRTPSAWVQLGGVDGQTPTHNHFSRPGCKSSGAPGVQSIVHQVLWCRILKQKQQKKTAGILFMWFQLTLWVISKNFLTWPGAIIIIFFCICQWMAFPFSEHRFLYIK